MRPGKPTKTAALAAITAAIIAVSAVAAGCGSEDAPTPTTAPEDQSPGPVRTGTGQTMTPEEVRERVDAYLAAAVWAEVSRETAEVTPERFRKVMFWRPDNRCIREFRHLKENRPDATEEDLMGCARSRLDQTDGSPWNQTDPLEREARARQTLTWMWDSVNPSVFMAANLAFQRAIDAGPGADPAFDEFAGSYEECDPPGKHGAALAAAGTAPEMAQVWRDAVHDAEHCAGAITEQHFPMAGTGERPVSTPQHVSEDSSQDTP